MIYLLLMTCAGSALLLGYLLWQKLFESWLTETMKYRALLSVLWVYMVPWVWLKRPYEILLGTFLQGGAADDGIMWINFRALYSWSLLAGIVWSSGMAVLLTAKLAAYIYERNLLLAVAEECGSMVTEDTVKILQEEPCCRGRVKIYRIPGERISLAAGLIKPVIFLQDTSTERERDFVLRHEMIHIGRKDALLRLFLELVCCVYWMNPLVYVLKSCFLAVRETSCDERVLRGCTKEERAVYAKLITESMREQRRKFMFVSGIGDNYKQTRRRVELIMQEKEIRRPEKWAAAGCFFLLAAVNSLTALFYPGLPQAAGCMRFNSVFVDICRCLFLYI